MIFTNLPDPFVQGLQVFEDLQIHSPVKGHLIASVKGEIRFENVFGVRHGLYDRIKIGIKPETWGATDAYSNHSGLAMTKG